MDLLSLLLILHWNNLTDFNGFAFESYYSVRKKQATRLSHYLLKKTGYAINIGWVRIDVLAQRF